MTPKSNPLDVKFRGYGHWRNTMLYRGKERSAITTNSQAVDRYNSNEPNTRNRFYNSPAQAWKALKQDIINGNYL